jgi:hypothetical protein
MRGIHRCSQCNQLTVSYRRDIHAYKCGSEECYLTWLKRWAGQNCVNCYWFQDTPHIDMYGVIGWKSPHGIFMAKEHWGLCHQPWFSRLGWVQALETCSKWFYGRQ